MTGFVIAIDGPSGTGKSTVAREVARRLRAGYLDTGAMYRRVSLAVLRAGVDPHDDKAVEKLLPQLTFSSPTDPDEQRHLGPDGEVTDEIRSGPVTLAVTPVSANPAVRAYLFTRQHELAHSGRMVVEGRDIGTVIAPDAELKIFLTADATERARRRHRQYAEIGASTENTGAVGDDAGEIAAVQRDLYRRDSSDAAREHAPLAAADDAVRLDSSADGPAETVDKVLTLAAARGIS